MSLSHYEEKKTQPDTAEEGGLENEDAPSCVVYEEEQVIEINVVGLPDELYAGMRYECSFEAFSSQACTLQGSRLLVYRDETAIASLDLRQSEPDASCYETDVVKIDMIDHQGTDVLRVVLLPAGVECEPGPGRADFSESAYRHAGSDTYKAVEATLELTVLPHSVGMAVWGTTGPVVAGEPFTMQVGIQCCADCDMLGSKIVVYDEAERVQGECMLEAYIGHGQDMYQGELALRAPETIAAHQWRFVFEPEALDCFHSSLAHTVHFTTAERPNSTLVLKIMDAQSGEPLEGVSVSLSQEARFPYRARTDAGGQAHMDVVAGEYRLGAVLVDYRSFHDTIDVEQQEMLPVVVPLEYQPDSGI